MDPATRRYSRAPGVLSFVGFAPADDPRLAILVLLDEPKNEKWGSEAAAPIFAAIGARGSSLPPRPAQGQRAGADRPRRRGAAPDAPAGSALRGLVRVAGVAIAEAEERDGAPLMPSLVGLSLRQAMQTLSPLDVRLEVVER